MSAFFTALSTAPPLAIAAAVAAAAVTLVAAVVVQRVPRLELRGKTALVTGGSAGIGLAVAQELARRGAHVVIAARRQDVLTEALATINAIATEPNGGAVVATSVVMDVGDESSVATGVAAACQWSKQNGGTGAIDVVVCNAGFGYPSRFLDIPADVARRMMDVNFFGCVNVVRRVLPRMQERKAGRIVLVSSMAGSVHLAGFTVYSATKAAVRAFAASLDQENAARGVRVQVLNPPDVATPGFDTSNEIRCEENRRICQGGGDKTFTADAVARATVDNMQRYTFQINVGMDGWLLGLGTANMDAPTSLPRLLLETAAGGVVRLVMACYARLHYGIVRTVLREEGLACN
jgi:3-dehydrosphinganine reductase